MNSIFLIVRYPLGGWAGAVTQFTPPVVQVFLGAGNRKARYLIEITGFFGCGSQI